MALETTWRGSIAVGDTSLAVERLGEGPLLVAVHGGLGFDATTLRPWLDPLAGRHTLVYPDLRGQGHSPRLSPEAWSTVGFDTFVADLDALREQLGAERMVLLGHSYGAFIALAYALAHPSRLDGLVLISAAASFAHAPKAVANALARGGAVGEAFVGALGRVYGTDDAALARDFSRFVPLYFHAPARSEGVMDATRYCAAAYDRGNALLASYDLTARLGEVAVPTLLVTGDDDFITPADPCATVLAQGLRAARAVCISEAGHFPFVEAPEATIGAITDFLATLGP